MHRIFFVALTAALSLFGDGGHLLLLRQPTLSRTQIVFTYAADLWVVPREGGDAKRLTAGQGTESDPYFSPDGMMVAFTGHYDGNTDVFVVPATGGIPKRLTWHPSDDQTLGWTPDGKRILFVSGREAASNRYAQLFTVAVDGGVEEKVPVPMGFEGAFSPDGKRLAYGPLPRAFEIWKRYRGGLASALWIADLSNSRIEKIPRDKSNDFNPVWIGDTVYFLSDRNGPVSLFSFDTKTRAVAQVLPNTGLDLKSASAGPGAIVYEQFGSLNLFDVRTRKTVPVNVRIAGDLLEVRERFVNVGKRLRAPAISPSGVRAAFEARGEIVTVPAEKGDTRNLTNTPGANEREPAWSPDGRSIAYFSDESGEYELRVRDQTGAGDVRRFRLSETPRFYAGLRWSPDGKKVSYVDSEITSWYLDLEKGQPVRVDRDRAMYDPGEFAPRWSPDSKWLTYAKQLSNMMEAVFVYSLETGRAVQVTDGMSDARSPVFDKNGKYLYFAASTDIGPAMEADLHAATRPFAQNVYLVVLGKADGSPFAPESDEEKPAEKADEGKKAGDESKPAAVNIDFEDIGQRILAVPLPARRYGELMAGAEGVLFAVELPPYSPDRGPQEPEATVHRFDLKSRKSDTPLTGIRSFLVSGKGEKVLYRKGEQWVIAGLKPIATEPGAPPAGPTGENTLKADGIEVRVNPRAEWRQMYNEAWRIERDFFYDPGYHGLDLQATKKRYEPYLESIASHSDFAYLMQEAFGNLVVGHLFIFGGDWPEVKQVQTGLLGADYRVENGRYRFDRVFSGENWNPRLRAPLTQPGVNVKAGEYLLAVNGREVRASESIHSFFEGLAGKSVLLRVGPDPSGTGARDVTVTPVPDETGLRNLAWIEGNRRKVDQLTKGRVAYVYMPDTSQEGLRHFNRYFFAQVGKEALILDERFNGGGQLATDIIEYLKRPLMSVASTRFGDFAQPQGAIYGPKVMIINEYAGSGGDAMPWYFRRQGVGKLVGKRTWGGLVGMMGQPDLMDGTVVTAPNAAIWNPNGEYDVENIGVSPDIEVDQDPELVRQGRDPQLEKAVEVVMAELEKNPPPKPKRPPYPRHYGSK